MLTAWPGRKPNKPPRESGRRHASGPRGRPVGRPLPACPELSRHSGATRPASIGQLRAVSHPRGMAYHGNALHERKRQRSADRNLAAMQCVGIADLSRGNRFFPDARFAGDAGRMPALPSPGFERKSAGAALVCGRRRSGDHGRLQLSLRTRERPPEPGFRSNQESSDQE